MEAGTKLGPYEILDQLGAGGMGEVWLAEDTRLGRKVAVKILPEEFAADPDRLARFTQEARAAAALNHPHIAAVHDVGFEDGTHFMVQELLEGQSLRDLLAGGVPPLKKTLVLATEIGEALRAAHKAGIIHRDLKPDNIFVSPDGHAKVLDFGLAKLSEGAGFGGDGTKSPTAVASMTGQIMGTAGYMSPEQIEAGDVDHRADLFAFGCVLYEMTTGKQPFAGKNVYETLGRIVSDDPAPLQRSVSDAPTELQRIVRKALAKDPELRYQSAGDAVVDLKMLSGDLDAGSAEMSDPDASRAAPPPAAGLAWTLAGPAIIVALLAGVFGARFLLPASTPVQAPVRFDIPLPGEETNFNNNTRRVLSISPDGRSVVFSYEDLLWVRRLDQLEAAPLRNTEDGGGPVFSPDSTQIAFRHNDNSIKRIAVTGGAAVTVGDGESAGGLHWATDGYIYVGAGGAGIYRLAETGGPIDVVVEVEQGLRADAPWLLPGNEWLLYTRAQGRGWNDGQIVAHSLVSGEERVLVEGGTSGRYVDTGHLLYVRDGVLYALRFDADQVVVRGGPVALVEQVRGAIAARTGAVNFDVSTGGDLVYVKGRSSGNDAEFRAAWVDRDGNQEPLPFAPRSFATMDLSGDGRRLAIEERETEGNQIWLYQMDRTGGQRLTTEAANVDPVWSADSEWVYFGSSVEGSAPDIWRRRADLTAPPELVYEAEFAAFPWSISNDGNWLLFHQVTNDNRGDIWRLSLDGEAIAEPLISTSAQELRPAFSPDGRYLAYQSNESGRNEIYVSSIETGERWLISTEGGFNPRWARNSSDVIYISNSQGYAVSVETEPELTYSDPRPFPWLGAFGNYETSADGQRTLQLIDAAAGDAEDPVTTKIYVVLNWFEELLERAPIE